MLALLAAALFGASVSGEITTALWSFSMTDFMDYTRVGSVVGSSSDRTTIEYTLAGYTNTETSTSYPPATVTLGGLTYIEYTATIALVPDRPTTAAVACSRANEQALDATCVLSYIGLESGMSEYCGYYSRSEIQTTTYTEAYESTTVTGVQTIDFRTGMPDWCTNSTALSELANSPTTLGKQDMATYALVLSAGEEKLSASATRSGSEAGSVASTTSGSTAAATAATGSVVATGAAMSVYVPKLAGMGVVAAFFL